MPAPVDRARLIAHYEARAAAPEPPGPAGGLEQMVERDIESRIVEWARSGVMATRRLALECGCGTGRVAATLLAAGVPTVGVDVAHAAARRAAERLRNPPAAMFAAGATEALPFRDATFGAVVDVRNLHHYADPRAAAAEWARVLARRGALVLAEAVEREDDDQGFFTELERAAAPGIVSAFYRSFELEELLDQAGFEVENRSYYRIRRPWARLEEEAPAGADPAAWRTVVEAAPPDLRESYEVNEEGMTCRFLALLARRR